MLWRILSFAALAISSASPAFAAWHVAKSRHFVIYADKKPAELAAYANRLERFDKAVRVVRLMNDPAVGDGNRLTIFVLPSAAAVRKLAGDKMGFVDGFYLGNASGPVAFVPARTDEFDEDYKPDTVFFHEYAHHLMFQALDRPLPAWLVEGFAELLSTVRFKSDGSVVLGAAASHRAWTLYNRQEGLPLQSVLSADYTLANSEQRESVYGLGWLLTHYLTFDPARQGQLVRYVDAIAAGRAPKDAAVTAFGDVKQLDRDLSTYLNRATLKALVIGPEQLRVSPVGVEPLTPGGAAVILARARSRSGAENTNAEAAAAEVRAVQRRFPGDALVELTLSEAELDAGHPEAAEAAAVRALAADPRNTDAMVLRGRAMVERGKKAPDTSAALFDDARAIFIAANKLDTEDPEPLMQFYMSFQDQRRNPTPNAVAALHYASSLAPQDLGLRLNSAYRHMVAGNIAEARKALVPIAYDPHGDAWALRARQIIARLDAGDAKGGRAIAEASSD
jgi:hypothetical protein